MRNQVTTVYKQAERFAEITKKLLITGNTERVKKCLLVAEKLFKSGNSETKNVISGIYVHSVSSFMEFRGCKIAGLFPQSLQQEYLKQINATAV